MKRTSTPFKPEFGKTPDYVLGVSREEYDRLKVQHSLWKPQMLRLLRRGEIPGKSARPYRVLDCGCGPGFTSFELAEYLGPKGTVLGVDLSEKYLELFRRRYDAIPRASRSRLAQMETLNASLDSFSFGEKKFDAAYARWIFIFLKDPETAIINVARHLKPGGVFLLQEYVDYRTMSVHPSVPVFRKFVEMTIQSWADRGGDANVARRLPAILEKHGFEVLSLKPQARVARPHQKLWGWPDPFYRNYVPFLKEEGYLSAIEAGEVLNHWESASRDPSAFFVGPLVLDIVARKLSE